MRFIGNTPLDDVFSGVEQGQDESTSINLVHNYSFFFSVSSSGLPMRVRVQDVWHCGFVGLISVNKKSRDEASGWEPTQSLEEIRGDVGVVVFSPIMV